MIILNPFIEIKIDHDKSFLFIILIFTIILVFFFVGIKKV